MEIVKILGVDASLRNTGLSLITYNSELPTKDPKAFRVEHCQVLVNPQKYKGTDAIINMLEMISLEAAQPCYSQSHIVIIESPPVMFNKEWGGGTIASIAHISGGCAVIFGLDKSRLFRPTEWNRGRKKEVTHNNTIAFLGEPDTWGYRKPIKSQKLCEHIFDATSMALWWIKQNYLED
jgi:hypothetical protein